MCNLFSFVTDPINHPASYFYFDWEYRKANLEEDNADSHSHICKKFNLREDVCNKYEYYPLTKAFIVDQINSEQDDSEAAEKWANRLDFKTVVEPLIVKPIVNSLKLPKVEKPTDEQIGWLKEWISVWDSVMASVWASVWASVGASVVDSVRAYIGSFFILERSAWKYTDKIECDGYPFQSVVTLWEMGLVPSFDGKKWRLHGRLKGKILWEGEL